MKEQRASMRVRIIFLSGMICMISIFPAAGRDFLEAMSVSDPLTAVTEEPVALFPTGYGEFAYINHMFISSEEDVFYFGVLGSFTAFNLFNTFAAGGYYSCYNLIGPFKEGDPIVNIGRWWMNAVNFEYAITAAVNILSFHLTLEYARTSQHNFTPTYSEVSTDRLKSGIVFPEMTFVDLSLLISISGSYVDLFDFWESVLPKPRIEWIMAPQVLAKYKLNQYISLFLRFNLDWNFLRKGGMDASPYLESGVILGKYSSRFEFFLEYYQTADTEELLYNVAPATLLGLGFRTCTGK